MSNGKVMTNILTAGLIKKNIVKFFFRVFFQKVELDLFNYATKFN